VKTAIRGGLRGMAAYTPDDGVAAANNVTTIQIQRFDLADVKVVDAKGKKVEEADLARLLKKETFAMASLHGEPIDPLHLRVLKEGMLIFGLPAPKPAAGANMQGAPGGGGGRSVPVNNRPMLPGQRFVPQPGQPGTKTP
jgi:hypothetical protein